MEDVRAATIDFFSSCKGSDVGSHFLLVRAAMLDLDLPSSLICSRCFWPSSEEESKPTLREDGEEEPTKEGEGRATERIERRMLPSRGWRGVRHRGRR